MPPEQAFNEYANEESAWRFVFSTPVHISLQNYSGCTPGPIEVKSVGITVQIQFGLILTQSHTQLELCLLPLT